MKNFREEWSYEDFYQGLDDERIKNDLGVVEDLAEIIEKQFKGKIASLSDIEMRELLEKKEEMGIYMSKISIYFFLKNSKNTQDQEVIKKIGEFENFQVKLSNKLLFISSEMKDMGSEKLIELSKSNELLEYENYFLQKAKSCKYQLDEKIEQALNLKETSGTQAIVKLYSELTNSFTYNLNIDGEEKELTEAEIRALREDEREEVRKMAYEAIKTKYLRPETQITLGNCYKSVSKDLVSEMELRGFSSVLSMRNLSEEMEDEVIDMLIFEVRKSFPLFQKFLRIKAKILGEEKLKRWNLLAPIGKSRKVKFDEGVNIFFNVMQRTGDIEGIEFYKEMFEKGRVDVYSVKGKRGGAFSVSDKGIPSNILLNYTDKLQDVSTLAHELGHAYHGYLSQKNPSQTYEATLCLCETASIFNELLLSSGIIETLSEDEKVGFLSEEILGFFSAIHTQISYVIFEKKVHESFRDGVELSYKDFNKLWREIQEEMFGDSIEFMGPAKEEVAWSSIPHIFRTPFYCYSYAFGNILSFALYEKYTREGASFISQYKNILASGGSKEPAKLLLENGFDIKSPKFYQDGLKILEEKINEFERLVKDRG